MSLFSFFRCRCRCVVFISNNFYIWPMVVPLYCPEMQSHSLTSEMITNRKFLLYRIFGSRIDVFLFFVFVFIHFLCSSDVYLLCFDEFPKIKIISIKMFASLFCKCSSFFLVEHKESNKKKLHDFLFIQRKLFICFLFRE